MDLQKLADFLSRTWGFAMTGEGFAVMVLAGAVVWAICRRFDAGVIATLREKNVFLEDQRKYAIDKQKDSEVAADRLKTEIGRLTSEVERLKQRQPAGISFSDLSRVSGAVSESFTIFAEKQRAVGTSLTTSDAYMTGPITGALAQRKTEPDA